VRFWGARAGFGGGAVVVRFGGETDDELVRAKSETRTVSTFLSLIVVKAM